MSKLIILSGLPASGKSTLAARLLKEYGNAVRINRDLLRTMLHCDVWSGKKEGVTRTVARAIAKQILEAGNLDHLDTSMPGVVIIDETNLDPKTLGSWKQLAEMCNAEWEVIQLSTSVEECLARDRVREKRVGDHVIIGMALQAKLYPLPERGIVLCDIDGTIADCTHRRRYLEQDPKDWDGFFREMSSDGLIEEVAARIRNHVEDGCTLFYVSGRPDTYRAQTEHWLDCLGMAHHKALFMRRGDDRRPDTVVKQEILDRYFPEPYRRQIQVVYDDRPSICRMWEAAGLHVVRCGNGEEF